MFVICLLIWLLDIKAQSEAMTIDDKCLVQFNGYFYDLDCHLEIPDGEDIQKYVSKIIFNEENLGLKEAYDTFTKLWKREESDAKRETRGTITINLRKEYELDSRFSCYRASASLAGTIKFKTQPENSSIKKMKAQYFSWFSGIDRGFIVDIQKRELVDINQILIPTVAGQITNMFGADLSLYAEDRVLQFYSKKNDARLIFSKTTEQHFTDYFKQLVGWGMQKDYDAPRFLRGEAALKKYFTDGHFPLASDNEEADTVSVSLVINEEGAPLQPKVVKKSKYFSEKILLQLCEKMPKWMPAYQDGKPIMKEVSFNLRLPRIFDVIETMPQFPGGDAALIAYLAKSIKYPIVAEENGIQGLVICTFVVERDGRITNVKVRKSVDPTLDKESIRVLSNMPNWIPGQQGGVPVRVRYTVPVTFRLN